MANVTKYYRDADGNFLGAFASADENPHPDVPAGAIECPAPPSGKAKWVNGEWEYTPPYAPLRMRMYEEAGITDAGRIDALWDAIMEADTTKADALKAAREAVRADPNFPVKAV